MVLRNKEDFKAIRQQPCTVTDKTLSCLKCVCVCIWVCACVTSILGEFQRGDPVTDPHLAGSDRISPPEHTHTYLWIHTHTYTEKKNNWWECWRTHIHTRKTQSSDKPLKPHSSMFPRHTLDVHVFSQAFEKLLSLEKNKVCLLSCTLSDECLIGMFLLFVFIIIILYLCLHL